MSEAAIAKKNGWQTGRWGLLTAGVVMLAFLGGIVWPDVFRLSGVNAIAPIFSDLIAILAAGEADQMGRDVFKHNPLDPFNRPHVYGPWWLVVGDLGLVRADARWLGLLLAGGFLLTAVRTLRPADWRSALMATMLLGSPPVLLAMERGNNDLVIYLLLVAAAWSIASATWFKSSIASGVVILAAALKFYPVVVLPMLAAKQASGKRICWLIAGTVVAGSAILLGSWKVYQQVLAMAPEPMTIFGYGAKLSYYLVLTMPEHRGWLITGALPVMGIAIWLGWRWRKGFWTMLPTTGFTTACYVAGALSWGVCYASTISFPYRMVLLLLPAALGLRSQSMGKVSYAMRFQWVTTALLMWSPCAKEHLLLLSADESHFSGSWFAWYFLGIEHALALIISVSLGLALLGWLYRRLGVSSIISSAAKVN
jgi:hypothetical protein